MMGSPFLLSRAATAALAAGAVLFSTSLCRAADASPWDAGPQSAIRLIAGRAIEEKGALVLRAGLEIKLQPGWKTYWRYPGDSGVPPRFDFSGSTNVRDVTVLWPAPVRFRDGGGTSIGYTGGAIFPLHVHPADPQARVTLRVRLDYGVCEKLCVPVDAKAELALASGGGAHDAALAASEARVPRRRALRADEALSVVAVTVERRERPRVQVDVKAPDGVPLDLFAEGPTPEWSLPLPEPVADAPAGIRRFAFDLEGLPPGGTTQGAALKLTAITPVQAIDTIAHLD